MMKRQTIYMAAHFMLMHIPCLWLIFYVIWKLKGADHTCDCIFLCSNMQIEGLIWGGYLVGSTYMGAYTLFSTTSLNIKKHGSGFGRGLITWTTSHKMWLCHHPLAFVAGLYWVYIPSGIFVTSGKHSVWSYPCYLLVIRLGIVH